MDAISIDRLTKHYGTRRVADVVNLRVPAGCVYGFLGRNGAGKSTLIKMLLGMVQPDAGHATLLGEDIRQLRPATRARIAYLAEGHPLYRWMTVSEAVRFTRRFYTIWHDDFLKSILDHFRLSPRQKIGRLSNGQRAQVSLSAQYTSYRTVDGQTLTDRRQIASTSAASLSVPHPEHYSPQPLLWTQRIRGYTDGQSPPTYWYLINNGLRDGRAYFVGYEHPSNRIVDYLGTGGSAPTCPRKASNLSFRAIACSPVLLATIIRHLGVSRTVLIRPMKICMWCPSYPAAKCIESALIAVLWNLSIWMAM